MKPVKTFLIIVIQFIAAYFLGFIASILFVIGDGWELVVMVIGSTVATWVVGAAFSREKSIPRLIGTAVGSILGVLLILITPAIGLIQVLFPLIGALLGYHLTPFIHKQYSTLPTT